ncbi:unnamed protein product, partial [Owenia fusiformis]
SNMSYFNKGIVAVGILLLGCLEALGETFVNIPKTTHVLSLERVDFKFKWVASDGSIRNENNGVDTLVEVAATTGVSETAHMIGSKIVGNMLRYAPDSYFEALANNGRVGFFLQAEGSTVYPEYVHLKDRPECAGRCNDDCSDTCIDDTRKYDLLPGIGGVRATCVDDNLLCNSSDPYGSTYNVLNHEFAHTYHQYGLPEVIQIQISIAYQNAYALGIWDTDSKAMANDLEYFAEASTVFFNTNNHGNFSGGMNSCGRPSGFCQNEAEARDWLNFADNDIYNILVEVYTGNRPMLPGDLAVCTTVN